jgi:hypothetical protein
MNLTERIMLMLKGSPTPLTIDNLTNTTGGKYHTVAGILHNHVHRKKIVREGTRGKYQYSFPRAAK